MSLNTHSIAVGVFRDPAQVERVITELQQIGIADDCVGIAVRAKTWDDVAVVTAKGVSPDEGIDDHDHAGLTLATVMLPELGPALFGGALADVATHGLIASLVDQGLPEDEAASYDCEFKAGRILLTVQADEAIDKVLAVLERYGADASSDFQHFHDAHAALLT